MRPADAAESKPPISLGILLRRWRLLFALIGALIVAVWALAAGWPGPIQAVDIEQGRLNTALPAPTTDAPASIRQTFRPTRNGLYRVEFIVVKYEPEGEPIPGALTVRLIDDAGHTVAWNAFEDERLNHNDVLALEFAPELTSADRLYTLELSGDAGNRLSAWAYDLDVYAAGALTAAGEDEAGDLRFTTRYRLNWPEALTVLGQFARDEWLILATAILTLPLPGALLLVGGRALRLLRDRLGQFIWVGARSPVGSRLPALDPPAWCGLVLAFGVAAWPILWQWLMVIGVRWSATGLWLVVTGGWLLLLLGGLSLRGGKEQSSAAGQSLIGRRQPPNRWRGWRWEHLVLLGIILLGLAVRLLAVRDLAFPPWVDSSRHALITAVMVESGQVIGDYGSYLPIAEFPYHYGFHALAANLALMTGLPLERVLLVLGQLLNALVPLTAYAAGWLLTRRRDVGVMAAFLVALPFLFPGYYATWGRFTQLTGVLILPPLLALTWLLLRGARAWRGCWWMVGLLAAGLFLIHVRVFLVYLPFPIMVWLISGGRNGRRLLVAGVLAILLVGPRMIAFAGIAGASGALGSAPDAYNAFPDQYVDSGWERHYWRIAGGALLFAGVAFARRRSWSVLPLTLALWALLVLGLLYDLIPGVPNIWLINLNSAYITMFVPLALFLAIVTSRIWRDVTRLGPLLQVSLAAAAGAIALLLLLFGARQQIDIINPATILARDEDQDGLSWTEANLPPDALVAVNSWRWLGNTWAGSDGGAWLLPLTGLTSTTPPVDYVYNSEIATQVRAFNEGAAEIADWSEMSAAQWLRDQGVTHIFVGARGGEFDPAELARNPALSTLYAHDGIFVFSVLPGE